MEILKFMASFLAIYFTYLNTALAYYKATISPTNLFIQVISITVFVFIQFHL